MSLVARIAKKIARRFRRKGVLRKQINLPGRNRKPITAKELWQRVYRFTERKPARAGTKRRQARERRQRMKRLFQ